MGPKNVSQRIRLDRAVYSAVTLQTTTMGKREYKGNCPRLKKLSQVSVSQSRSAIFPGRPGEQEAPKVSSYVEMQPQPCLNWCEAVLRVLQASTQCLVQLSARSSLLSFLLPSSPPAPHQRETLPVSFRNGLVNSNKRLSA